MVCRCGFGAYGLCLGFDCGVRVRVLVVVVCWYAFRVCLLVTWLLGWLCVLCPVFVWFGFGWVLVLVGLEFCFRVFVCWFGGLVVSW